MTPVKYRRLHTKLKNFPLAPVKSIATSYNKAFHAKIFTLFASSESEIYSFAQLYPAHYDFCLCFINNDQGQWYLGNDQIERVRNWVLEEARKDSPKVSELYQQWKKNWEKYLQLSAKLQRIKLEKLSKKKLYALFEEFHCRYVVAGSVAYIADAFMSTGTEDWLETLIMQELTKVGVPNTERAKKVRILTSPVHLSFTLEAEYQLLKTAHGITARFAGKAPSLKTVRKEAPYLGKELQKLEQKFHWIQNNYYNVHYLTAEEFYDEICHLIQEAAKNKTTIHQLLSRREQELQRVRKEKEELLNSLALSPFMKNLVETATLFSKWKDVRKSGVYIGMYHYDRFLAEVARRTGYNKKQLNFLVFDEIKEVLLDNRKRDADIAKREKQCFFAVTTKDYFIAGGEEAKPYFTLNAPSENRSVTELKGVVACMGYARGRVRIIRKTEEMKQFQTGEILVTNQTTPEFVPVMKKAAAIITEQGGITSHAAVVARELGKPCIIGTKIATTALLNGEVVEVDANNGVVRRER